ncbi:LCP family protein [Arthrobacter bambusae]|uniref:LCP family protein n=1 Tax=Arthrobacter bambusae TaxID=1338426 RepID=UPI002781C463|nr:LCP family protein [Arthrobacter bambusae]MDQ0210745.1 LCP family protein required for cell wall assembly [Arthrobacter bambusae]MDQ0235417.1 LCP family protein required for cell wall assembly [Arthrobacter bambusae]
MRRRDARVQEPGTVGARGAARHGEAPGTPRHMNAPKGLPIWLKVTAATVSVLLLGGIAFAAYWVIRLQSNISTAPLSAGAPRTEAAANDATDRLQILILGSDTRDGKNSQYGSTQDSTGYGQSDVMMLLDISADNKRVSLTSIPRDLLVDVPSCTDPKTGTVYQPHSNVMINSAMAEAGIGCAVDTVNKLMGLQVDHFMMADFNAVKELSNAVGGVNVCVSDAVYDPDSGLRLPKGTSSVQGEQALAFLRTRHGFGDGSDLGRIQAQQGFLSSLTRKIKSDGTLGNPQSLLSIADAVTKNLTVDEGLASVQSLLTIGSRLKDVDLSKVAFVSVPTQPAAVDPNRLELVQPQASQLFAAMRANLDLTTPGATAAPSAGPTPAASGAQSSSAAPPVPAVPAYDKALQPVTVADGTGVASRGQEIAAALAGGGFTKAAHFLAAAVPKTVVYYGAGYADVAPDVASLLGIPASQIEPSTGVVGVQVYIGSDFDSGTKYGVASVPSNVVKQTAGDVKCQAVNPALIAR